MSALIDREQWSASSKRSFAYHLAATMYKDIPYRCAKCHAHSIFTAKQQKEAYEVRKQYIWRRRTLCGSCNGELFHLKTREQEFQHRWAQQRTTLRGDRPFLLEWLSLLEAIPTYGQRARSSMKTLLNKLLASNERSA